MPNPTTRLGLKLQDKGSNLNTWGDILNTDAITLIDEAFGVTAIVVSSAADVTLSNTIYATNQARRDTVQITGTPGAPFNVIVPSFDKRWFIDNRTAFPVTVKMSSGTGAVVRAGDARPVYSDGTNCYVSDPSISQLPKPTGNIDMSSAWTFTNLPDGTAPQTPATKKQLDDVKAYAQGLSNSGILAPGSVDGRFLQWSAALKWHEASIPPLVNGTNTTVTGNFDNGTMAVNVDLDTPTDFLFALSIARP